MTDLAALVVRMQADNSSYIKALDQATGKLSQFSKDQTNLLKDLGEKFAAAFTIDKIVEFSVSSIESAASLDKMAQSSGIAVENLSALSLAAAASGLSQDDLGLAFKKLNVSIAQAAGDGSSKAAAAFKSMGISVTDASGNVKSADAIFAEVATKFQGYADGPNKVAIAVQLLGRQGQNLIPVLNQGAAGLDDFRAKAEAAGIVMSGELAAAAEEFSQKAAVLKTSLVEGLGNQLAAQLLPVLNTLVDQFSAASSGGSAFAEVAGVIVGAVKVIATLIIEAVSEFQQLGQSFGAVGAAAVAAAQGNFSEAATIWKQSGEDNVATQKTAADRITALWHVQSEEEIAEAKAKYELFAYLDKNKPAAPNEAAAGVGEKAIKELEKYTTGIKDQELAFGLGGAALTRYKLQFGPLADAIKNAGDEGKKLAVEAQSYADKLQFKVDTRATDAVTNSLQDQVTLYEAGDVAAERYKLTTGDLGKAYDRMGAAGEKARNTALALEATITQRKDDNAIKAIDDQTLVLTGHLNAAALSAFDLQNRALKTNLTAAGDTGGLDKLAAQRGQVDAQSQINELNLKASQINTDLSVQVDLLNAKIANGQVSQLVGDNEIADARTNALMQLQAINTQEQTIATTSGSTNVALVDGVKKFGSSLVALQTQTKALENSIRSGLESAFANNFADLITGAKSFTQAIRAMATDIEKQFVNIIAKNFAENLFGTGGAAGGLSGMLAGFLGGGGNGLSSGANASIATTGGPDDILASLSASGYASGGTIPSGQVGLVGEEGPELAYSGSQDMNIVPMKAGGGVSVTNHFIIQAPSGQISRQSQMQTAAAAARSIGQANRRNNQ